MDSDMKLKEWCIEQAVKLYQMSDADKVIEAAKKFEEWVSEQAHTYRDKWRA